MSEQLLTKVFVLLWDPPPSGYDDDGPVIMAVTTSDEILKDWTSRNRWNTRAVVSLILNEEEYRHWLIQAGRLEADSANEPALQNPEGSPLETIR